MPDYDHLQLLIGDIYSSALDPARWPATLKSLALMFNGNGAGIHEHDFRTPRWNVSYQVGFSEEQVNNYARRFFAIDPRLEAARNIAAGNVLIDAMHISEAEMDLHAFYQEFLAPSDMRYYIAGALAASDDRLAGVTIQRARSQGPFNGDDRRVFSLLLPHLQRALAVQRRLGSMHSRQYLPLDVLEKLPGAVALLSSNGKLVFVNRAAEIILSAGDGLRKGSGGLTACHPHDAEAVGRLINNATSPADLMYAGTVLYVRRPSGRLPLIVWASPISPGQFSDLQSDAQVMLFIRDPESRLRVALPPSFFLLYSLTRMEAQLLGLLVNGVTPEQASVQLCVGMATVRKHMRNIFRKTNVRRQVDLIRLALAAAVQPPSTVGS